MSQYPYIFLFLAKADEETDKDALLEISERRDKYRRIMEALRDRADITIFTSDVDYIKLWKVLDFTVDGLMESAVKGENFRSDIFLDEAVEYVDMIRMMTYKS